MADLRSRKTARGSVSLYDTPQADDDISKSATAPSNWLASWSRLVVCWLLAIAVATHFHYKLPTPRARSTGTEFSEHNAMQTISYLSDTLGYRIVGTVEEAQTIEYLESALRSYKTEAQGVPGAPKFDMWTQKASGAHRFDIMEHMVYKAYTNITNIVVRLSCPEHESRSCEENAILINSHFDTTLGSPGATDDGSGIAVMLELVRVLSTQDWSGYRNSIVFLFNGAEESLQDASHAFITMHDVKDSIRSVVNIDACGTTGREILFQANSREMIEAYKQAPYPHGTVVANDVFRTGLILSDTDFRQFVQYGNLTGIDMAIYKNSYLYHTHLDVTKNLEPGSIQHLGENTLAIVQYLAKNSSLTQIEPTSEVVFFDTLGLTFTVYSWATAYTLQMATAAIATLFVVFIMYRTTQQAPYRTGAQVALAYAKSSLSIVLSALACIASPIAIALFLTSSGRHMAWFGREWYGAVIFCPMAFFGAYGVQYLFYALPGPMHYNMEYGTYMSIILTFALSTFLTTQTSVASSYIFWIYCSILLAAGLLSLQKQRVHWSTYVLSATPLALIYTDYTYALIDIFVPLTGRMGVQTPVDVIIAIVFGMITFMTFLPGLAHVHRFGKAMLRKILIWAALAQVVVLGLVLATGGTYGGWAFPYDEMHPKRVFVQHLKNMTSGEAYIGLAQADHGPYLDNVIHAVEDALGVETEVRGSGYKNEWDTVYPFSEFLGGFRFNVEPYVRRTAAAEVGQDSLAQHWPGPFPSLTVHNDRYDPETGVRSFSILSVSPTYTWTVLSFDAQLVDWSIESPPLPEFSHYVVRHVVGHGSDAWRLDVSVKVPEEHREEAAAGRWKLRCEFTAMEQENFAGRGEERLVAGVRMLQVIDNVLPIWTTPTYMSSTVQVWHL